jgi:hypothetical protein
VEGGKNDLSTIYLLVKIPLNKNRHVNNERQERKIGHVKRRALVQGGG